MTGTAMKLEDNLDFVPPPHEQIRLKGTRIGIEHVIRYHKGGMTAEQIAHAFAYPLQLAQVYAAITYYLQRKDELDAYVRRIDETGDQLRQELEKDPGHRALREKLAAARARST
jgi:uncharacterized protein (DUF433 family)